MDKANMYWQTYLNLENELIELSKYIYITDTKISVDAKSHTVKTTEITQQLETYSNYIADLLIRSCVEIEFISKELYLDNGGIKPRGRFDLFFDTDCIALLNERWGIANKVVMVVSGNFYLTQEGNRVLKPLNKADKRSKTIWSKAYQAVKHDRYNSLYLGNIKALLHSLAALYLLNIYYRDIKFTTKYLDIHKLDMSMGSKVFSLKAPEQLSIVNAINGIKSVGILRAGESPYIAKYTDAFYKQVLLERDQYIYSLNNYLQAQPEFKESEFVQHIMRLKTIESQDPQQRVIPLWELFKYRLNKKIPATLPFDIRKSLFIQSEEWKGTIRGNTAHLSEDELTPENMQKEMDSAATSYATEIDQSFLLKFLHKAFNEGYCEVVLDKGDVKYQ